MNFDEIKSFIQNKFILGSIFREYGGFYETLKKIILVLLPDTIIGSETQFIHNKCDTFDFFTIPEYVIQSFLKNDGIYYKGFNVGYQEYRYNFAGDKLLFYNIEINKCGKVSAFTDSNFHTTYEKLKKVKPPLVGFPEYNY